MYLSLTVISIPRDGDVTVKDVMRGFSEILASGIGIPDGAFSEALVHKILCSLLTTNDNATGDVVSIGLFDRFWDVCRSVCAASSHPSLECIA